MTTFPYDAVQYPGRAYDYTHPDRLAVLATLHGMAPAAVPQARVLELGCGDGGNIIPIACQNPDARIVGIDLSRTAITEGCRTIAALGLGNVQLLHGSIADLDERLGPFDYIIVHGVYSWVPDEVRSAIWRICASRLAPAGVCYVSYNSHPGSHFRELVRDIMLFHTRGLADSAEQIAQARAILAFVAEASDPNRVHGAALRDQRTRVRGMPDYLLFHDDLDRGSRAFLLNEVAERAAEAGLQYLAETELFRSDLDRFPPAVAEIFGRFPPEEFVRRQQYVDFIDGHGFNRSLFCRREVPLRRDFGPDNLADFYLAAPNLSEDERKQGDGDKDDTPPETGYTVSVEDPLDNAALEVLGAQWPAALPFEHLCELAGARVGRAVDGQAREQLKSLLFRGCKGGRIRMHLYPPTLAAQVSDRPRASRLARLQAAQRPLVTSLRHTSVLLEDDSARDFLQLVDGSRSVAQLAADFAAAEAASGRERRGGDRQDVRQRLQKLARSALLEA